MYIGILIVILYLKLKNNSIDKSYYCFFYNYINRFFEYPKYFKDFVCDTILLKIHTYKIIAKGKKTKINFIQL